MNKEIIGKGFKKSSKVVFFNRDTDNITINNKNWKDYFSDPSLKSELASFIDDMIAKGHKIGGIIRCRGGGVRAQLKSIMDALMRSCGMKPKQDIRHRKRNLPGLRGVNKGPVRNKR